MEYNYYSKKKEEEQKMKETKLEKTIRRAFRFQNLNYAKNFAYRTKKMVVMLGENKNDQEEYLVVTMAEASLLEKNGFQWA